MSDLRVVMPKSYGFIPKTQVCVEISVSCFVEIAFYPIHKASFRVSLSLQITRMSHKVPEIEVIGACNVTPGSGLCG